MEENQKLSVIVPIYGMEKFIEKCLESILAQSYKDLEVICVNDATNDSSMEIVKKLQASDDRIKIVNNPENLGLFRARVAGMRASSGRYVAFVDADDFVSIDWFRLLINRLVERNADMVIGNTVSVDENGRRYYYNNYKSFTRSHKDLCAPELFSAFMENEGSCYSWHTVWNKVYTKELIERCLPYFETVDYHLIMLEDVAFSSVFYTHAKKLTFIDADCYFYYRHSSASTSSELPHDKVIKNITDVGQAFEFFKSCLISYDEELFKKHEHLYIRFKERYHRIWSNYVSNEKAGYLSNKKIVLAMQQAFGTKELSPVLPYDFYFYNLETDWSDRFEYIKGLIASDEISVVSFDIFDTLIKRPFYEPTDLYLLVGKYASTIFPFITPSSFKRMRLSAESSARKNQKDKQDILISDIYTAFANIYSLPLEDVKKLEAKEIEYELKYCTKRRAAKELYDFAISVGKPVIITSDMYLPRDVIEKILTNNGYTSHERLFLSSDVGLLKHTGALFRHVVKEIKVKPSKILHIGDNWGSDVVEAKKQGFVTHLFPKALDVYKNDISDIYTGNGGSVFKKKSQNTIDSLSSVEQLPTRCALALMANNMFDNPYTIFQHGSSYNADTYYMGYSALGMHVLGVAEWMWREAIKNGYKRIVFLARDGKMMKEAFDMLCRVRGTNIETKYFYATRKALMPYSIKCADDLYNINQFVGVYHLTPRKILDLFKVVLKPLDNDMENKYLSRGISLDEKLTSEEEIYSFIRAIIDISYDQELNDKAWAIAKDAFQKIFDENTATFDAGYSGRLQSIICDLASCPIDTFYIHSNGYNTTSVVEDKFKIHSYYDFTPTLSSIVREFFISDPTPSCYAYEIKDGEVIELIEEKTDAFCIDSIYAINETQKGALDFVSDYLSIFGDMGSDFVARNVDYAVPFDHMLLTASDFDRYTFVSSVVEDEVFSGYNEGNMYHQWSIRIPLDGIGATVLGVPSTSADFYAITLREHKKIKKFLFLLLFDRRLLKEKVKPRLKKHKIIYHPVRLAYKILRKIYHIFRRK